MINKVQGKDPYLTLLSCLALMLTLAWPFSGFAQGVIDDLETARIKGYRDFNRLEGIYSPVSLPTVSMENNDSVRTAARREISRLFKREDWHGNGLSVTQKQLLATLNWLNCGADFNTDLTVYQLAGEDGSQNAFFTGYYTPILDVSHQRTPHYTVPVYRLPSAWPGGKPLSRREIDEGGLDGLGLELVWTHSLLEFYLAQVQGSPSVRFADGKQEEGILLYGGRNGFAYNSLGKALIADGKIPAREIGLESIRAFFAEHPQQLNEYLWRNPSYVFYQLKIKGIHPDEELGPFAASGAVVTPLVTAAVDTAYIPHGAVLLAEVPQLDGNQLVGYQWRLLIAQDRGGAIKGPGRVDIYMGKGEQGKQLAGHLNHYGRLYWLVKR